MPGFDGTGPRGGGPLTGRGLGGCGKAIGRLAGNRRISWPLIGVTIAGAVARDVRNPDGLLRRISSFLGTAVKKKLTGCNTSGGELATGKRECLEQSRAQSGNE